MKWDAGLDGIELHPSKSLAGIAPDLTLECPFRPPCLRRERIENQPFRSPGNKQGHTVKTSHFDCRIGAGRRSSAEIDRIVELFSRIATQAGGQDCWCDEQDGVTGTGRMNQRPPVIAKVTEGDSASPVCFSSLYAYELDPEFRLVLRAGRKGMPPFIKLDDRYKLVDQLEDLIVHGVPSLARCRSLTIEGNVQFQSGVEIVGDVKFVNQDETRKEIPAGVYDEDVSFL